MLCSEGEKKIKQQQQQHIAGLEYLSRSIAKSETRLQRIL